MQDSDQALQQEILDFWFGFSGSADYGKTRDLSITRAMKRAGRPARSGSHACREPRK